MEKHHLEDLATRLKRSASNPSAVESIAHELANEAMKPQPPQVKMAAVPELKQAAAKIEHGTLRVSTKKRAKGKH